MNNVAGLIRLSLEVSRVLNYIVARIKYSKHSARGGEIFINFKGDGLLLDMFNDDALAYSLFRSQHFLVFFTQL